MYLPALPRTTEEERAHRKSATEEKKATSCLGARARAKRDIDRARKRRAECRHVTTDSAVVSGVTSRQIAGGGGLLYATTGYDPLT